MHTYIKQFTIYAALSNILLQSCSPDMGGLEIASGLYRVPLAQSSVAEQQRTFEKDKLAVIKYHLSKGDNSQSILPLIQEAFRDENANVIQGAREALAVLVEQSDAEQSLDDFFTIDQQLIQAITNNDLAQVQAIVGNNVVVKPVYGLKALLHLAIQEAGEEKLSIANWLVERAKYYVQQDILEETVSNIYITVLWSERLFFVN